MIISDMIITISGGIKTVDKLRCQKAQILMENLRLRRRMEQGISNPVIYSQIILNNEQSLEIIEELIKAQLN